GLGRAGLALVVLGLSTAGAMAQRPVRPLPPRPAAPAVTNFYPRTYYQQFPPYGVLQSPALPVNPNYYVAPGLTLNQYAYNLSVLGQALSNFPPYALGYNPYPVVANYGPVYNVTPFASNPFLNPYAGALGGAYVGTPYLFP